MININKKAYIYTFIEIDLILFYFTSLSIIGFLLFLY